MVCEYLDRERGGFAISFEIAMTMFLTAIVVSATLYFAQAFELQRYFADVTSSTCTMASRYGGNLSKAYAIQVKTGNIEDNANKQLAYIQKNNNKVRLEPGENGKYITVSDYPDSNNDVTVTLQYSLGKNSWGLISDIISPNSSIKQTFKLPSLMQNGKLIR